MHFTRVTINPPEERKSNTPVFKNNDKQRHHPLNPKNSSSRNDNFTKATLRPSKENEEKVISLRQALSEAIQENEVLRDRVMELEALLAAAQEQN